MSAPSSSPASQARRSFWSRTLRDRRGAVLVFVALGAVLLIGIVGLTLDGGRGFLEDSHLARAADAGALAGARALRQGEAAARQAAIALAAANGESGGLGATINVAFSKNSFGEDVVTVTTSRNMPTTFMRVMGINTMGPGATASATVPPLDLSLVLDQSGSLGSANAFDDLQDAAKNFVNMFSERIDQLALTSFQVRAGTHFQLNAPFKAPIRAQINTMVSAGDTNSGEALRLGYQQLLGPRVRPRSIRVLVFFTDGRPTAFRGILGGQDRAMAVSTIKTGRVRGYFDNPDALPLNKIATPSGCAGVATCFGFNEDAVRTKSRTNAEDQANIIRNDKIFIYSIGLGDPKLKDPILQPDMAFLRRIANENGIVSTSQPQGKAYFAPSAAELDDVFRAVAQDIVIRLTQ
jgi:Flp pilus assembly protein TadG